jgi:hypothetical protein
MNPYEVIGHATLDSLIDPDWAKTVAKYGAPEYMKRMVVGRRDPVVDLKWDLRDDRTNRRGAGDRGDLTSNKWHRDCGANRVTAHDCYALMLWADVYPTEIKVGARDIFTPPDGAVVLVDNVAAVHRRPLHYQQLVRNGIPTKPRHFGRIILPYVPSDEVIDQLKEEYR